MVIDNGSLFLFAFFGSAAAPPPGLGVTPHIGPSVGRGDVEVDDAVEDEGHAHDHDHEDHGHDHESGHQSTISMFCKEYTYTVFVL